MNQVTTESFETGIAAGTIAEFLAAKIKEVEAAVGLQAAVVVMLSNDDRPLPVFIGITPAGAGGLCLLGAELLREEDAALTASMRKDLEQL